MRLPEAFAPLVDHGVLDEVVRPLMSGKEAMVYLVISEGRECVAKVYKDAKERSFKNKAEYTEGRRVRNSRDQRAMSKRTAYGRARDEAAWKSTEVDMIYRLSAAGVRVPEPYWFVEGVLLMELVCDADGSPAKRLGELQFTPEDAQLIFEVLLADVIRMLHAGVVHGDLSEFNVLMAADGPVIIDFPQAIDASGNLNARKMLMRDVDNLHRFVSRFVRGWASPPYAEEMWSLYERGELKPDTQLTGKYVRPAKEVHVSGVMDAIDDARADAQRRFGRGGPAQHGPRKRPPEAIPGQARGPQQQTGARYEQRPRPQGRPDQRPQQSGRPDQRTHSPGRVDQGPRAPQQSGRPDQRPRPPQQSGRPDQRPRTPQNAAARGRPPQRDQRPTSGERAPRHDNDRRDGSAQPGSHHGSRSGPPRRSR